MNKAKIIKSWAALCEARQRGGVKQDYGADEKAVVEAACHEVADIGCFEFWRPPTGFSIIFK